MFSFVKKWNTWLFYVYWPLHNICIYINAECDFLDFYKHFIVLINHTQQTFVGLKEEEEKIYFSKQKHSVQPVVCLNTIISNNKKYYIQYWRICTYKYSDAVNDLISDVAVTSLSFVRLVLTGKLKSSTRLICFQISSFRDKQVFLLFRLSFVYNLSC